MTITKKPYSGLTTTRVTVECQQMLANSNQKIKAKTEVKDWGAHEESYEMGSDGVFSISSSEEAPVGL